MEIKKMEALPQWEPECRIDITDAMKYNAPFVHTSYQKRNDLGDCIICTFPPHFVCKVHGFRTSDKRASYAEKEEAERMEYLNQRKKAIENGMNAARKGITVREYVESLGMIYDQEFDEPRIVTKVPGLNVYLEFYGCLEPVSELEWEGGNGVYSTIDYMAKWAHNCWDNGGRKKLATKPDDEQPLESWKDSYDPEIKYMLRKRGIGITYIDPSRRPELLYTSVPSHAHEEYEMIMEIKRANAELASRGIKPENYGKI